MLFVETDRNLSYVLMVKKSKEISILFLLTAVYLFCSVRYYPGRMLDTLVETLMHIFAVAPFSIGLTLISISFLRKMAGSRPPGEKIARIFFTVSIVMEFFFGLYNYVDKPL